MLVLNMNSKRQRRPNVRLGEIGDISAAFSCNVSQRSREDLEENRWKHGIEDHKEAIIHRPCGFSMQSSEFVDSSPGRSAKVSKSNQSNLGNGEVSVETQNWENCNPNLVKPVGESASFDEFDSCKPKLDFGTITRKGRVTKRMRSSGRVGWVWSSRVCPEIGDGNEKGHAEDEFGEPAHPCYDVCTPEDGFKDSDHETSESPDYVKALGLAADALSPAAAVVNFDSLSGHNICKEPHQNPWFESVIDQPAIADSTEFWTAANVKETNFLTSDAIHGLDLPCERPSRSNDDVTGSFREQKIGPRDKVTPFAGQVIRTVLDSVGGWLNELGLSKYAHVFETHEVDKEVLPLLSFEDLKEMGIVAVGPRRKLYTAIQLLKEGFSVK